jgi:hypothetical protein
MSLLGNYVLGVTRCHTAQKYTHTIGSPAGPVGPGQLLVNAPRRWSMREFKNHHTVLRCEPTCCCLLLLEELNLITGNFIRNASVGLAAAYCEQAPVTSND